MASSATKKARTTSSRISRLRWWFQGGFLLVWLDPLMLRLHTVCSPVFHCYSCPLATFACPIGILANYSAWHLIPFMTLGILFVVGSLFGSFVCGWACPFGFLQDLLDKIPTPKFRLPNWVGAFRYFTLIGLVVAIPYFYGEKDKLFFCSLCPAGALEAAVPNTVKAIIDNKQTDQQQLSTDKKEKEGAKAAQTTTDTAIPWPSNTKIAILVGVLGLALFTWRPWCRIFCPLGAIYSLFDPISVFFLRFHKTNCIECADCRGACRDLADPEFSVDGMRCVRCLDCANCRAIAVQTAFSQRVKPKAPNSPKAVLTQLENPKD